jgi:hypothetical protein
MPRNKCSLLRSGPCVRKLYPGNPLWPLAELRDLHDPSFVPDPEFIRFDLNALSASHCQRPSLSAKEASRSSLGHGRLLHAECSIPRLVTGLPWRFAKDTKPLVVPDPAFVPFELALLTERLR